MSWATADLCDAFDAEVVVAAPIFRAYGGHLQFCGPVATVKVFEDNALVKDALAQPGQGRVLVVDGGGSLRCALMGDLIAAAAVKNGWAGVVIWGCIRDSAAMAEMPLGVRALATHPRKTVKAGAGTRDVPVHFADVTWTPGAWVYADADGVLVAPRRLTDA